MGPGDAAVKAKRRYDSTRRQDRARRARDRIVKVAEQQFLAEGYATTSIAAIAREADTSVDTIYKTFGGKAGLIRAIHERALQGQGPTPAERRSDMLQADEADPHKIIQGWGRFTTEIAPRAAPIILLIRSAAATDPELDSLRLEIDAERLRRMTGNARRLHDAGHLRPGITVAAAADVLWTYSSPELYELLVLRRRMPLRRYGRFVADAIAAALLRGTRSEP
jgi:AcrR family transcriptional regulator